jgi:hypothetical protein
MPVAGEEQVTAQRLVVDGEEQVPRGSGATRSDRRLERPRPGVPLSWLGMVSGGESQSLVVAEPLNARNTCAAYAFRKLAGLGR